MKAAGMVVLVVVLLILTGVMWSHAAEDCKRRGGHMERIWGGKSTRYFCDGATK